MIINDQWLVKHESGVPSIFKTLGCAKLRAKHVTQLLSFEDFSAKFCEHGGVSVPFAPPPLIPV